MMDSEFTPLWTLVRRLKGLLLLDRLDTKTAAMVWIGAGLAFLPIATIISANQYFKLNDDAGSAHGQNGTSEISITAKSGQSAPLVHLIVAGGGR